MKTYKDNMGSSVQAFQVDGCCIVNTINGEVCASDTEWVVYLPTQKTVVFTNEAFQQSFTEVV